MLLKLLDELLSVDEEDVGNVMLRFRGALEVLWVDELVELGVDELVELSVVELVELGVDELMELSVVELVELGVDELIEDDLDELESLREDLQFPLPSNSPLSASTAYSW